VPRSLSEPERPFPPKSNESVADLAHKLVRVGSVEVDGRPARPRRDNGLAAVQSRQAPHPEPTADDQVQGLPHSADAVLTMSRLANRRESFAWPILIVALFIALLIGVFATLQRREAIGAAQANSLLERIAREANRLDALEWQAVAERRVSAETERELEASQAEVEAAFSKLGPRFAPLAKPYTEYAAAVDEELHLIGSGLLDKASAFDEERVDQAFATLDEALAEELNEHREFARSKEARADLASLALVVVAAFLIALLVWQYALQRRAVRRERLQSEQLRELDHMKDEFVAGVSHELRTPLTSIRGYVGLLREGEAGDLTDRQESFLEIVDRNSDRLQKIVADLLFVAEVDAGTLSLERGKVDLSAVVAESVAAAGPHAEARGVELSVAANGIPFLSGDRGRLGQLLDNLISNAIKFTPEGGQVSVSAEPKNGLARVTVADTGIGIPPQEQELLFERFFRASSATELAIQGTGLGLSIAKAIVDAHNGTIAVRSQEGTGTTFTVELPLTDHGSPPAPLKS
jgi:signal transduction histidine kinase